MRPVGRPRLPRSPRTLRLSPYSGTGRPSGARLSDRSNLDSIIANHENPRIGTTMITDDHLNAAFATALSPRLQSSGSAGCCRHSAACRCRGMGPCWETTRLSPVRDDAKDHRSRVNLLGKLTQVAEDISPWRIVVHATYGIGLVMGFAPEGAKTRYVDVQFESGIGRCKLTELFVAPTGLSPG